MKWYHFWHSSQLIHLVRLPDTFDLGGFTLKKIFLIFFVTYDDYVSSSNDLSYFNFCNSIVASCFTILIFWSILSSDSLSSSSLISWTFFEHFFSCIRLLFSVTLLLGAKSRELSTSSNTLFSSFLFFLFLFFRPFFFSFYSSFFFFNSFSVFLLLILYSLLFWTSWHTCVSLFAYLLALWKYKRGVLGLGILQLVK